MGETGGNLFLKLTAAGSIPKTRKYYSFISHVFHVRLLLLFSAHNELYLQEPPVTHLLLIRNNNKMPYKLFRTHRPRHHGNGMFGFAFHFFCSQIPIF